MREIKFRALDDGKMIYSHNNMINNSNFQNKWFFDVIREDAIIMQYTGLKDKNGVLYCQDDVVRYKGKNYRLLKGAYAFELLGFYESSQDVPHDFFGENAYIQGEVIGNIYQNPELLK